MLNKSLVYLGYDLPLKLVYIYMGNLSDNLFFFKKHHSLDSSEKCPQTASDIVKEKN